MKHLIWVFCLFVSLSLSAQEKLPAGITTDTVYTHATYITDSATGATASGWLYRVGFYKEEFVQPSQQQIDTSKTLTLKKEKKVLNWHYLIFLTFKYKDAKTGKDSSKVIPLAIPKQYIILDANISPAQLPENPFKFLQSTGTSNIKK